MLATLVPLLLAAAAPSATERNELEQAIVALFQPYRAADSGAASWDYPLYSVETAALIAQWRALASEGEVDALGEGDWLCQCQDWNAEAFTATIEAIGVPGEGFAEIDLTIDPGLEGSPATRPSRLILKREADAWKVDDIIAESFPQGLKQALRETIAADQALTGGEAAT